MSDIEDIEDSARILESQESHGVEFRFLEGNIDNYELEEDAVVVPSYAGFHETFDLRENSYGDYYDEDLKIARGTLQLRLPRGGEAGRAYSIRPPGDDSLLFIYAVGPTAIRPEGLPDSAPEAILAELRDEAVGHFQDAFRDIIAQVVAQNRTGRGWHVVFPAEMFLNAGPLINTQDTVETGLLAIRQAIRFDLPGPNIIRRITIIGRRLGLADTDLIRTAFRGSFPDDEDNAGGLDGLEEETLREASMSDPPSDPGSDPNRDNGSSNQPEDARDPPGGDSGAGAGTPGGSDPGDNPDGPGGSSTTNLTSSDPTSSDTTSSDPTSSEPTDIETTDTETPEEPPKKKKKTVKKAATEKAKKSKGQDDEADPHDSIDTDINEPPKKKKRTGEKAGKRSATRKYKRTKNTKGQDNDPEDGSDSTDTDDEDIGSTRACGGMTRSGTACRRIITTRKGAHRCWQHPRDRS